MRQFQQQTFFLLLIVCFDISCSVNFASPRSHEEFIEGKEM